jgi:peroxiredoxin Q/BCP
MMQLHQDYEKFSQLDTIIVVIGPEDSPAFKAYWDENKYDFIGIPDKEHEILKLYGQKVNIFKLGRMPGQMIIDKNGILRYVHYGNSMSDIPKNEELIKIIEELHE